MHALLSGYILISVLLMVICLVVAYLIVIPIRDNLPSPVVTLLKQLWWDSYSYNTFSVLSLAKQLHIRSLGHGNVFTSVCPQEGEVLWCHFLLWTAASPWTATPRTAASPGLHPLDNTSPSRSTSGRYISYWNAFLFCHDDLNISLQAHDSHGICTVLWTGISS